MSWSITRKAFKQNDQGTPAEFNKATTNRAPECRGDQLNIIIRMLLETYYVWILRYRLEACKLSFTSLLYLLSNACSLWFARFGRVAIMYSSVLLISRCMVLTRVHHGLLVRIDYHSFTRIWQW